MSTTRTPSKRSKKNPGKGKTDTTQEELSIFNLEYATMRDEYSMMRDEIMMRIQKQQEITSFSIAILVGFITLNQFLSKGDLDLIWGPLVKIFYPIISTIYSAFSLMVLEHEINIAQLYIYIDTKLQSRINIFFSNKVQNSQDLWGWNRFRAKIQHHSGITNIINMVMAWSKYAMTIIPNIFILIFYTTNDYRNLTAIFKGGILDLTTIIFIVSLLIFCWVIVTAVYAGSLYLRMVNQDPND